MLSAFVLATNVLIAVLLIKLISHRLALELRWFALYLTYQLLISCTLLYLLAYDKNAYLEVYWYGQLVSAALGYVVLWEMMGLCLRNYAGAHKMLSFIISSFFVVMAGFFAVGAFGPDPKAMVRSVIILQKNIRFVQGGLFVLFFACVAYFSISIQPTIKVILTGYGAYVLSNCVVLILRSSLGSGFQAWWGYADVILYFLVVLVWTVKFWKKPVESCQESEHFESGALSQNELFGSIQKVRESIFKVIGAP